MSKRRVVPVRDYHGKIILFRRTREDAEKLLASGMCFALTREPLELALAHGPGRKQIDIERLRPDRSLTMSPSIIQDAADGSRLAVSIVDGYGGNHSQSGGCLKCKNTILVGVKHDCEKCPQCGRFFPPAGTNKDGSKSTTHRCEGETNEAKAA